MWTVRPVGDDRFEVARGPSESRDAEVPINWAKARSDKPVACRQRLIREA